MTEVKRNYEFRSIPEVPYIEVSRDGDVRYQKGKEQYDRRGALIDPHLLIKKADGKVRPIQAFITKAFPDIPMRYPQDW